MQVFEPLGYNQTSHDAIANGTGYVCEGALVSNLPHNAAASSRREATPT